MLFLKKNIGYLAMFLAVIGFGSGPPFVKLALEEFQIVDLLAVRFAIAFPSVDFPDPDSPTKPIVVFL